MDTLTRHTRGLLPFSLSVFVCMQQPAADYQRVWPVSRRAGCLLLDPGGSSTVAGNALNDFVGTMCDGNFVSHKNSRKTREREMTEHRSPPNKRRNGFEWCNLSIRTNNYSAFGFPWMCFTCVTLVPPQLLQMMGLPNWSFRQQQLLQSYTARMELVAHTVGRAT